MAPDRSPPLAPPGLDVLSDLASTSSVAGVGFPPLTSDQQVLADRIRAAVLAEVDGKIKVRMDEAFQRGKDMMNKIQQNTKEQVTELWKELTKCHEKIKQLETDNVKLVLALGQLDKLAAIRRMDVSGLFADSSPARTAYEKPSNLQSPIWLPQEQASTERDTLPYVPPFPTAVANGSPPQLSLTESLSAPAPQKMQLSLSETLSAPVSTEVSSAAASDAETKVVEFSFTILKADGMSLGLSVAHQDNEQVLHVEGVCQDGAVEAWNRQCSGNTAYKALRRGDKIVSVNSVTKDPAKMLEECRNKRLLKLSVLRTLEMEPSGASSLRAEASDFVPLSQNNSMLDAHAMDPLRS